jgi:hypothetical protein
MGRTSPDRHDGRFDARLDGCWREEPSFLPRLAAATSANNGHAIFSIISIIGSSRRLQGTSQTFSRRFRAGRVGISGRVALRAPRREKVVAYGLTVVRRALALPGVGPIRGAHTQLTRPFLRDSGSQRLALVGRPKLEQLCYDSEILCATRSTGQLGERCCGNPGKRAMMKMKRLAATAVLSLAGLSTVLADDQKPARLPEAYAPPLNLLMVATQLNHFKLWYAGAVQNWALADYELAQIRTGIERARTLYPNNVKSNMTKMTPVADEVENAIKAKDGVRFSKTFSKLTAECNSCHQATGFGFIKMRDPTLSPIETSPFSDESFTGH